MGGSVGRAVGNWAGVLVAVGVVVLLGQGVFVDRGVHDGSITGVGETKSGGDSDVNVGGTVLTATTGFGVLVEVGLDVTVGAGSTRLGVTGVSDWQPITAVKMMKTAARGSKGNFMTML